MRLIRNLLPCYGKVLFHKYPRQNISCFRILSDSFALCNAAVIEPTFRVVVSSRLTLYIYASPLGQSNPETARVVT